MEKCFNIAGPCFPDEHYMLPALERLPGIMRIVEQRSYFVLHAARQSGKTTALMALVGMRDIRDYKARIRPDGQTLGDASPFNIITEDLTLGNFKENDIARLYSQHTKATGQVFEPDAIARAWQLTRGQPWLVNALARECVMKIHDCRYNEPITIDDIAAAKEKIIRKNPVHLDYLFYIARHPSVRPFLDVALNGSITDAQREERQFRLLLLLGLLCECNGRFEFSNPIYKTYWDRCKGD